MLNYQTVSEIMDALRNEPDYPGYGFMYADFFWAKKDENGDVCIVRRVITSQDKLEKVVDEIGERPELALVKAGQYGKQTRAIGFSHRGTKRFDYENRRLKCNLKSDTPDRIQGDVSNIRVQVMESPCRNIHTERKCFLEFRMHDGEPIGTAQ